MDDQVFAIDRIVRMIEYGVEGPLEITKMGEIYYIKYDGYPGIHGFYLFYYKAENTYTTSLGSYFETLPGSFAVRRKNSLKSLAYVEYFAYLPIIDPKVFEPEYYWINGISNIFNLYTGLKCLILRIERGTTYDIAKTVTAKAVIFEDIHRDTYNINSSYYLFGKYNIKQHRFIMESKKLSQRYPSLRYFAKVTSKSFSGLLDPEKCLSRFPNIDIYDILTDSTTIMTFLEFVCILRTL